MSPWTRRESGFVLAALAGLFVGCDAPTWTGDPPELACGDLDPAYLADGNVGRDGIPSLTNPEFVAATDAEGTRYLSGSSRVIGVRTEGEWLVIPHNVMYRHEIVNLDRGDERIAVTYCPLTGSALAFDRASVGGAEFGVSGLLYQANLVMYDRSAESSQWPQMAGQAGCGPKAGQYLTRRPVIEMTWDGWRASFPASQVVTVDPVEFDSYRINPYGSAYEIPGNGDYLGFPLPREDERRPPKERVLGFPKTAGGGAPVAFPFEAMAEQGAVWIGELDFGGESAVVFWDAQRRAAVALRPLAEQTRLRFSVVDGAITDHETGSTWSVSGRAVRGALEGASLPQIPDAYVAFWQAWAAFHPGTRLAVGSTP